MCDECADMEAKMAEIIDSNPPLDPILYESTAKEVGDILGAQGCEYKQEPNVVKLAGERKIESGVSGGLSWSGIDAKAGHFETIGPETAMIVGDTITKQGCVTIDAITSRITRAKQQLSAILSCSCVELTNDIVAANEISLNILHSECGILDIQQMIDAKVRIMATLSAQQEQTIENVISQTVDDVLDLNRTSVEDGYSDGQSSAQVVETSIDNQESTTSVAVNKAMNTIRSNVMTNNKLDIVIEGSKIQECKISQSIIIDQVVEQTLKDTFEQIFNNDESFKSTNELKSTYTGEEPDFDWRGTTGIGAYLTTNVQNIIGGIAGVIVAIIVIYALYRYFSAKSGNNSGQNKLK
jgi:hypothetical protein